MNIKLNYTNFTSNPSPPTLHLPLFISHSAPLTLHLSLFTSHKIMLFLVAVGRSVFRSAGRD